MKPPWNDGTKRDPVSDRNAIGVDEILRGVAETLLAIVALALPWELYQRLPGTELTLTKVAGTLLIPVALVLLIRHRSFPRTGLERPFALFAAACLLSWTVSLEPAVTTRQLAVYGTYLLFFYAVVATVPGAISARVLMACYAVSSVAVALLTIAAYGGWVWPMHWDVATWATAPLLEEYRAGVPMRMTAASGDFNLAALELLIGLGFVLFAWRPGRIALLVAQWFASAVIVAAILIAMSRSGLVLAAGLLVAAAVRQTRLKPSISVAIVAAFAVIAAIVIVAFEPAFLAVLWDRTAGAVVHDEGSARGRMEVYRIGFRLIDDYMWLGCGLGAVDAALSRSEFAGEVVMTLHSLPFTLFLETGILGLMGYLWVSYKAGSIAVRHVRGEESAGGVATGFLAAFTAGWLMLLVQPFPMLSLYPFLLGAGLGPFARNVEFATSIARLRWPAVVTAVAVVVVVVGLSVPAYQRTITGVVGYRDWMAQGYAAQRAGAWDAAEEAYERAYELARDDVKALDGSYQEQALALAELKPLFAEMLDWDEQSACPPFIAAASYMAGRLALAEGNYEKASARLSTAWELFPPFEASRFLMGEAAWRAGMFAEALKQYAAWAAISSELRPSGDRRMMEWTQVLPHPGGPPLLAAANFRRLGQWDSAVAIFGALAEDDAVPAEVHFNLGVDAELRGDFSAAVVAYRTALGISPEHVAARERLTALAPERPEPGGAERITSGDQTRE